REERNFHGSEALQMNTRTNRLQPAKHVEVVRKRQVGMEAVDDVDFGERLVRALTKLAEDLLERHRIRLRIARLEARERTEETRGHADVRGLETQVVVVERVP